MVLNNIINLINNSNGWISFDRYMLEMLALLAIGEHKGDATGGGFGPHIGAGFQSDLRVTPVFE